jgi:allophanate hydrolase subunit 2
MPRYQIVSFHPIGLLKMQSRTATRFRENKLKVSDSDRTTFDCLSSRFSQQGNDILRANMAVGPVKVRQNASPLITESLEVNDKHTSIRLENPANLSCALQPCFLWQM